MSSDFNPQSPDAMFATILRRLDDIVDSQKKNEGAIATVTERVVSLERERWYHRGAVAAIAVGVTSVWELFTKK